MLEKLGHGVQGWVARGCLVASLGAAAVVMATPRSATLTVQAYAAFLAVLSGVAAVERLASTHQVARVRRKVPSMGTVADPLKAEIARLERQVELALARAGDADALLVPELRAIAARLLLAHGVDLHDQPERSRQLLGSDPWELVRPDRRRTQQPFAPGLRSDELASVLDALEAL